jgi:multidrug efflux system outer membrane protein
MRFADVANALVTRQKLAEVRVQEERAVAAHEDAVKFATERYSAGKASYYEVIDAKLQLFPAQVALAQTKRDQFTAIVELYRALGGGWNTPDSGWSGADTE